MEFLHFQEHEYVKNPVELYSIHRVNVGTIPKEGILIFPLVEN